MAYACRLQNGTNITITGDGSDANPYVINSSGGGSSTWQPYTPTTTNVTLGTGGILSTRYKQDGFGTGSTVIYQGYIELGTGGDITGGPTVTVPVAARIGNPPQIGEGHMLHPGNFEYLAQAMVSTSTGLTLMFFHGNWGSSAGNVNSVSPYNWDAGGKIYWSITYEVA